MKSDETTIGKILSGALFAVALMLGAPAQGWSLTTPSTITAKLEGRSVESLRQEWGELQGKRAGELGKLERLEGQYQQLADKIGALKRRGKYDRGELEGLLRQGKKLAEELDGVQARVRVLDERLEALGVVIASRIDAQMREVERGLARAGGAERAAIVRQLNSMSQERARYAQPVPRMDRQQLNDMLSLADRLDSPDDMMALADELQDAEVDVRARLAWVSKQLGELRARQRLVKRARTFAREESFFEEGDRSRVVARVDRQPNVVAPTARPSTDAPAVNTPPVSNSADPEMAPSVEALGPAGDRGNDSAALGTDDGQSGGGDSFYEGGGTTMVDVVVVAREADPAAAARRPGAERGGLDGRIRKLEDDEAELKRQAEALKRRAATLRERAQRGE
jgi:chromosome segregation ATPase